MGTKTIGVAAAASGLIVGIALGAVMRAQTRLPAPACENGEAASVKVRDSTASLALAVRKARAALDLDSSKSRNPPGVDVPEMENLRSELRRVEQELQNEIVARQQAEGTPVQFPEGVVRPKESDLAMRLERAFRAEKVPATIKAIDCSEYPCIAFAEIPAAQNRKSDQMQKLVEDLFGQLTAADLAEKVSFKFRQEPIGRDDDPEGQRLVFGIGLGNGKATAPDSEVSQRVDSRIHQYFSSLGERP